MTRFGRQSVENGTGHLKHYNIHAWMRGLFYIGEVSHISLPYEAQVLVTLTVTV